MVIFSYHLTAEVACVVRQGNNLLVYAHRVDGPVIWLPIIEYDLKPGDTVEWKAENGVGWFRINGGPWWSDIGE
jgi:hypothetical protein